MRKALAVVNETIIKRYENQCQSRTLANKSNRQAKLNDPTCIRQGLTWMNIRLFRKRLLKIVLFLGLQCIQHAFCSQISCFLLFSLQLFKSLFYKKIIALKAVFYTYRGFISSSIFSIQFSSVSLQMLISLAVSKMGRCFNIVKLRWSRMKLGVFAKLWKTQRWMI